MTPVLKLTALRDCYGAITARELAARLGIEVHNATWRVAAGRVIQFAECTRQPLQITLNDAAIEGLLNVARCGAGSGSDSVVLDACDGEAPCRYRSPYRIAERRWFTREQITEVILAHELFHLLTPAPSSWAKHSATEEAAHAFAQSWTGLPFHPIKYEQILWATFSA